MPKTILLIVKCKLCGLEFLPKSKYHQNYCSRSCAQYARYNPGLMKHLAKKDIMKIYLTYKLLKIEHQIYAPVPIATILCQAVTAKGNLIHSLSITRLILDKVNQDEFFKEQAIEFLLSDFSMMEYKRLLPNTELEFSY